MPNKTKTWIVVADGSRARFFAQARPGSAIESASEADLVTEMVPDSQRFSDRPGRVHDRHGEGRHAMEPPTSPKEHAKKMLARELAGRLEQAFERGEFDRLVVVAPPRTLGDIRAQLDDRLQRVILAELAKDISMLGEQEIRKHLTEIDALGPFPIRSDGAA